MPVSSIPKLAIVILNFNGREHLKTFLPSVVRHKPDYADIVIVDNASTDDSIAFLRANYPFLRLEIFNQNYGFAGGYQMALSSIEAEYYLILNSDVQLTETSIDPVIRFMDQNSNVAACQPKILAYLNPSTFEHAGACGGWIDRWRYPFCRGRIQDICEVDAGQYDEIQKVFWCTGAAMFIRAETYHLSGGFDPIFFAHMEEIDLCWRLQRLGFELYAVPQAVVYHLGGGTLSYRSPFKAYLNFRNSLFMIVKNEKKRWLVLRLIVRLLMDGAAAIYFLVKGEFRAVWSVLHAQLSFYRKIPFLWRKRRAFNKKLGAYLGTKRKLDGVWKGSIVIAYFLNKKKKFNQLDGL